LSFFLVPSRSSNTPLYPQSAASQGTCPDSLFFCYFHFRLTFESTKELGSMLRKKTTIKIVTTTKKITTRKITSSCNQEREKRRTTKTKIMTMIKNITNNCNKERKEGI
jgi:hypothetical protein